MFRVLSLPRSLSSTLLRALRHFLHSFQQMWLRAPPLPTSSFLHFFQRAVLRVPPLPNPALSVPCLLPPARVWGGATPTLCRKSVTFGPDETAEFDSCEPPVSTFKSKRKAIAALLQRPFHSIPKEFYHHLFLLTRLQTILFIANTKVSWAPSQKLSLIAFVIQLLP